ncbi:ABC transporter substrate-binding protein [Cupriavidus numazuensis]
MNRRQVVKALTATGLGVAGQTWMSSLVRAGSTSPIRIGLISSLSGAQAPLGQPMLLGAQIAVDQVNKAGGVNGRMLELVIRDDKAKPSDAAVAARELAGDGVNLMMGAVSSSVALAITPLLEQSGGIFISCAAQSDKLTKENFVRNYFRVTDNPYMRQRALAKMAAQRYPAVIAWSGIIPDHEYGRSSWGCFENGIREYYPSIARQKPVVTSPVRTQYGAPDYRTGITAAVANPAQGFLISVYGGDAVTLYKQAEPYGFFRKAKLIIDSANEFVVAKTMKQALPDMWVGCHWYAGAFEDVATSRALQAEAFRRTNDRFTLGYVAEGHAGVMAYVAAVQAAGGTETQAVVRALESVTFESATGARRFRKEDHQAIKPVVMYRLRGSARTTEGFEVVDAIRIPGSDVIDPPTPGKPLVLATL